MAHFRGTLLGNRGMTSRLGTKASNLAATLASWQGAVSVQLWYDPVNETDMAEVRLTKHNGVGSHRLLYHGPVSGKED